MQFLEVLQSFPLPVLFLLEAGRGKVLFIVLTLVNANRKTVRARILMKTKIDYRLYILMWNDY